MARVPTMHDRLALHLNCHHQLRPDGLHSHCHHQLRPDDLHSHCHHLRDRLCSELC
jgi:hypothetical protein